VAIIGRAAKGKRQLPTSVIKNCSADTAAIFRLDALVDLHCTLSIIRRAA
jgi:hypothetical protein